MPYIKLCVYLVWVTKDRKPYDDAENDIMILNWKILLLKVNLNELNKV
jgi:hypothetical protein